MERMHDVEREIAAFSKRYAFKPGELMILKDRGGSRIVEITHMPTNVSMKFDNSPSLDDAKNALAEKLERRGSMT